jgi:dienelactone hydrolase
MSKTRWLGAVVLAIALPARSSSAATESFCSSSSWVAGIIEICSGHLVYRDYVYDDYGADSGVSLPPISTGPLAPSAGDVRYPAGAENTADLVKLDISIPRRRDMTSAERARFRRGKVDVVAELNTLYDPDQTIVAVALDTVADAGGGAWPGLGIQAADWDEIHVLGASDPDTVVDTAANTIRGSFARPRGRYWRIWAVTAQADGTVMNVAFRGPNEGAAAKGTTTGPDGAFWEDQQAVALGGGDITAFSTLVKVAEIRRRKVTRLMEVGPGLHQRVYTSQYTLPPGEGISLDGIPGRHGDTSAPCEQFFHYLGKYQPYGVYIPTQTRGDGSYGLQLVMHGCSANHSSLVNQPGMQQDFGEDLARILVVPLGRGPVGFYSDISERDVLDVIGDLFASYAIDADHVFSGGYSMGGYGTMRFAALYPDLFAGASNWVGFTGNATNAPGVPPPYESNSGALENIINFIGNLRHIPIVNIYAGADELVTLPTSQALRERFADTDGVVHDFYLHPDAEHLTFAALDDWTKEAAYTADLSRVGAVARVTYRTDRTLDFPEYAIRHDAAYWTSDIVARADGYADVDLTSEGCGLADPTFELGNDAGAGPPPLVWTRQYRRVSGSNAVAAARNLSGSLTNVASLTINTAVSCLVGGPVDYSIHTDGAVEIALSDGRHISIAGAGDHAGTVN